MNVVNFLRDQTTYLAISERFMEAKQESVRKEVKRRNDNNTLFHESNRTINIVNCSISYNKDSSSPKTLKATEKLQQIGNWHAVSQARRHYGESQT